MTGPRAVASLLRQRRLGEALAACRAALAAGHTSADLHQLHARALQANGLLDAFRDAAARGQDEQPGPASALLLAEAMVHTGAIAEGAALALATAASAKTPAPLLQAAELLTHAGHHSDAVGVLHRAVALAPDDRNARFNLLAALVTLGDLDAAGHGLTSYLAAHPDDWDAWHLQAGLRRCSDQHNHVASLRRLLAGPLPGGAEVPLGYALGKELEDLGEHQAAWQAIDRAARARRQRLGYRVAPDLALHSALRHTFSADWLASCGPGATAAAGCAPLFVCGLPRTGTTLVDRVLAAHSSVTSLGEVNDLVHSLLRCTAPDPADAAAVAGVVDPAARQRDLVRRAAALAPGRLGATALASYASHFATSRGATSRGATPARVSDKTPMNSLYLGLLAAALPDASLVLVQRHPLDTAWAMYKTLFRMGYPFSYDLGDLAAWLTSWHQLAEHWQQLLAERLVVVRYEDLVQDQANTTRHLLDACQLPFEPGCLEPHRAAGPVATASASQVREPVHSRSVAGWQHHAEALAPLAAHLQAAGIAL